MSRDALSRLVHAAEQLPSPTATGTTPIVPRAATRGIDRRRQRGRAAADDALEPHALKTRVRELLFELARRVDTTLPSTLAQADGAWDQIDAISLLDRAVDDEVLALHRAARLLAADAEIERSALGLEAQLTLDAALGLTSLIERRLATLVRLRLRAADDASSRPLLVEGRPFLDLGAALFETARRWI